MSVPAELRDKIERISNLPTLPQIASRLLHLISDSETSASDVAGLVEQDIALSAKVIRLANSAYYGAPREIASIQTAVVRLGFRVINTIVLSLSVFDMFPAGRHSARFDRRAFWRHCLRCGLYAKLLVQAAGLRTINAEEAFCAGLLHDIGKVVMDQYLHEDFMKVLNHASTLSISFTEAEKSVLEYSHTEVAQWLISRWELPDTLFEPIVWHHHVPGAKNYVRGVALCHLADYLCYDPDVVRNDKGAAPPADPDAPGKAGLTEKNITSVKARLAEEQDTLGVFIDLL